VDITFRKMEESSKYCEKLKSMLLDMLKKEVEDVVIVSPEGSSPYILNAAFPNVRAEVLLHHLETKNIFVSTGAACSSRKQVLSHVLRAMESSLK